MARILGGIPRSFINRRFFLFLVVIFSSIFFAGFVAYDAVLTPKANPANEKYLYIDTTRFFQKKYLSKGGSSSEIIWWASQQIPATGGFIPQGEYVLTVRAKVILPSQDNTDPYSLQVLLDLETANLKFATPTYTQDVLGESIVQNNRPPVVPGGRNGFGGNGKDNGSGKLDNGASLNLPGGGKRPPSPTGSTVSPPVQRKQIKIDYKRKGSFQTKTQSFRLDANMRGKIYIRVLKGAAAVVDYVSLKGPDGREILVNNSFNDSPMVNRSFKGFQGWSAGTGNWGYHFAFPAKIRSFFYLDFSQSAGGGRGLKQDYSGLVINSLDLKSLSRVYTRVEKVFRVSGRRPRIEITAMAPFVQKRGAFVWLACAGVKNKPTANVSLCPNSTEPGGPDVGKCFFRDPATNRRCYVNENQSFGSIRFTASDVLRKYSNNIDFPGLPEDNGPFWVRFAALDGSELFIDSLKISDRERDVVLINEDFDYKNLRTLSMRKRVPFGWSFGENNYSSSGFDAGFFAYVYTGSELGYSVPTPTPTKRPAYSPTPTKKPTNTPTPKPTLALATPTPDESGLAAGGVGNPAPTAILTLTPVPTSAGGDPIPTLTLTAPTPTLDLTNTPVPTDPAVEPTKTTVPTRQPTNTPALTPSPIIPTVSPTSAPVPDSEEKVVVNLRLRFQGIRSAPRSGIQELPVLVSIRRFGEDVFIHKAALFKVDDRGLWTGKVEFTSADGFSSGNYLVYVKGPYHLQKKICDLSARENFPGSYSCTAGKSIILQAGQINIDLSGITLLVGDLPDQDGLVNAYDIGLVRNLLGSTEPEDLARADVNLDGIVDITDFVLIQAALSVRYDEGEFSWSF